jgi:hypothetical protein
MLKRLSLAIVAAAGLSIASSAVGQTPEPITIGGTGLSIDVVEIREGRTSTGFGILPRVFPAKFFCGTIPPKLFPPPTPPNQFPAPGQPLLAPGTYLTSLSVTNLGPKALRGNLVGFIIDPITGESGGAKFFASFDPLFVTRAVEFDCEVLRPLPADLESEFVSGWFWLTFEKKDASLRVTATYAVKNVDLLETRIVD